MEQIKHQNHQTKLSKSSNITEFSDLLFFFSVLFLYSLMPPFIFNLMQFFSSNIGKNYMFLLCNGILVFIVKNSGLLGSSHQEINLIKNGESPQKELETFSAEKQEQEIADKCLVMVKGAASITQDVVNEEVNEITMVDEEHEDDEEAQDLVSEEVNEIIMVDEEHEDDEEEIGLLNVDELNKKCDDFIRKMKEEIKFEAQQLTLVHH